MSTYMFTASGRRMYPLEPTVEMIELSDIASHLSKQTRWTGATKFDDAIYTVAQHACLCALAVWGKTNDPLIALEALHHDSSEAILVDVARPLKRRDGFREFYMEAEARLTEVIYQKFNIPFTGKMHPAVKEADDRMLYTEARDIMPVPIHGMQEWEDTYVDISKAYPWRIEDIWSPREAKQEFLEAHRALSRRRERGEQIGKG